MIILHSKPLDQFERFWQAQYSLKLYKCPLFSFGFFIFFKQKLVSCPVAYKYSLSFHSNTFIQYVLPRTEISVYKCHMEGHYELVTLTSGIVSIT